MKKALLILSLGVFAFSFTPTQNLTELPEATSVYICDSEGAKKYHLNKNCRGLKNCNHKIIKVTIEEAKKKGKKTLCGWED